MGRAETNSSFMPEKMGISKKEMKESPPIIFGPQKSPRITGNVFIPAFLSPSVSFISLMLERSVNMRTTAKINLSGK